MKKSSLLRTWPVLGAIVVLSACQKEINQDIPESTPIENLRSGVIEDDPSRLAEIPMVVSQSFLSRNGGVITTTAQKGKPNSDQTPPNVAITTPGNGSTANGAVTVGVSASDNVKVTSVSLAVDGVVMKTLTSAPFNFSWNANGGAHTLTATAKDAAGNSAANSISINSSGGGSGSGGTSDLTAPTVQITSPANTASVSGLVTVSVAASDNVGVSTVTLSVDGNAVGTTSSIPYTFSWNSATVGDGIHTLTATASDAAGNASTSSISVAKEAVVIVLQPTNLPSSLVLNTPVPANQGGENCCTSFSITYGARSIEQYYKTGATSYSLGTNVFSPEFTYNLTKFSDCTSGSSLTNVLDLLMSKGASTWQSMPYSDVNGCSTLPDANQYANASNYKINSYVKVVNSDVATIKGMLVNHHPIIANITADNAFANAGPGFIWNVNSGGGAMPHAIVIVGYDDSKHAYKIMNSYGTTWGDGGFCWVDYDFFVQKSNYYAFVIQ